jgi:hypothetical protein
MWMILRCLAGSTRESAARCSMAFTDLSELHRAEA